MFLLQTQHYQMVHLDGFHHSQNGHIVEVIHFVNILDNLIHYYHQEYNPVHALRYLY